MITALCSAGLALVPIPPASKAPRAKGWNHPRSAANPEGYSSNAADFSRYNGFNFGLYHGASNTLALDLDDINQAKAVFEDVANINLPAWLNDPARCEIKSPKANRGKLLFKLPSGFDAATLRQLKHDSKVIFELRAGNCQDVIVGQHPEGGHYQFVGDPAAISEEARYLVTVDAVRISLAWLDAQMKTKHPQRVPVIAKHDIERWAGFYIPQEAVELAAALHPDVRGEYPFFNLSRRYTCPHPRRLQDIPSAGTHHYSRQVDFDNYEE